VRRLRLSQKTDGGDQPRQSNPNPCQALIVARNREPVAE
jgi:hypothetical protein